MLLEIGLKSQEFEDNILKGFGDLETQKREKLIEKLKPKYEAKVGAMKKKRKKNFQFTKYTLRKKKKQTKKQASLLYFLPLILQALLQKFKTIMASREKRIKQIRTKEMMGKQNEWFTKHRVALILRLQKQAAHWKKKCYANGITSFYLVFLHWNNPFWC